MQEHSKYDVVIIGAGVLGVTIAYWLSELYECSIALVDKEDAVARHTSSRNTGVVHRPFYLNPNKKRVFARASQKSYYIWRDIASKYNLTWKPTGTLEVAIYEDQVNTLDTYKKWAIENGMGEDEIEVLDSDQVGRLEPEVMCRGAIYSKTDTCVDYGEFTNFIFEKALKNGVEFLYGFKVENLRAENSNGIVITDGAKADHFTSAKLLVNAAGGGAIDVAHKANLAKQYTDLHFRGEYWMVDEQFATKITRNIYSVAKYKEFPFLDPHFIIRADGRREIGPNAVLVSGPGAYKGLSETRFQLISKAFERPMKPKLKLFTNGMFLSLMWGEWRSSVSKKAMCERVKQFVKSIDVSYLTKRGMAGVRSSVIDGNGFVPEAVLVNGDNSFHILNYNSPGATGAPAFSAYAVSKIAEEGYFDGMAKKVPSNSQIWKFEDASNL
jgi:L-2-hydroxyglutarate oxidase